MRASLWLQTTLTIGAGVTLSALRFWGRWDDQLEVRVNGVLGVDENSWTPSPQYLATLPAAANPRQPGANTITVHAVDFFGGRMVAHAVASAPSRESHPLARRPLV
ncbi:hypothetical protein DIPPA_03045 [Diplonema papillatum]|nr:hypothetical protein DIPPA_03045 [Diplonema papillatum]